MTNIYANLDIYLLVGPAIIALATAVSGLGIKRVFNRLFSTGSRR